MQKDVIMKLVSCLVVAGILMSVVPAMVSAQHSGGYDIIKEGNPQTTHIFTTGDNLLQNPGFEDGLAHWDTEIVEGDAEFNLASGRSGSYSGMIHVSNGGFGSYFQTVAITGGCEIHAEVWANLSSGSDDARACLSVWIYDEDWDVLDVKEQTTRSNVWTKLSLDLTTDSSAAYAEISLDADAYSGKEAYIRFDDAYLSATTQPKNINAQIISYDVDSGNFNTGDEVEAEITIKNTGNIGHKFYIGYSVRDKNGYWWDAPYKSIYLTSGEEGTKSLYWEIPFGAPDGNYLARVAVWKDVDISTNPDTLLDRLDYRGKAGAFIVRQQTEPISDPVGDVIDILRGHLEQKVATDMLEALLTHMATDESDEIAKLIGRKGLPITKFMASPIIGELIGIVDMMGLVGGDRLTATIMVWDTQTNEPLFGVPVYDYESLIGETDQNGKFVFKYPCSEYHDLSVEYNNVKKTMMLSNYQDEFIIVPVPFSTEESDSLTVYVKDSNTKEMISDASVYLDDNYKGKTGSEGKLIISGIYEGSHIVKVTKLGYEDRSTKVSMPSYEAVTFPLIQVNTPTSKKALIIAPYYWQGFIEHSEELKSELESIGYEVNYFKNDDRCVNDEVNIPNLASYLNEGYGIIHITSHGSESGISIESFESIKEANDRLAELKNAGYTETELYQGFPDSHKPTYDIGITGEFIQNHVSNNLPNSFVYFEACKMGVNGDMISAFREKGAGAYVGFDDDVVICTEGILCGVLITRVGKSTGQFYKNLIGDSTPMTVYSAAENSPKPCAKPNLIPIPHCEKYANFTISLNPNLKITCNVKGDTIPCDGKVGDFELLDYIDLWAKGLVGDFDLLEAIDNWAHG